MLISIHALRGEGDSTKSRLDDLENQFLSTPSAGRATATAADPDMSKSISIHALRGEGDR